MEPEALKLNDPSIPIEPGVYLIYCDTSIGSLGWSPTAGPAYVGKADTGLRARISATHLGDTGRSTLRRTYGALLKHELALRALPRPSRGDPKPINFTNYTFEEPGDSRLTEWMLSHLRVTPVLSTRPADRERDLVSQYTPPLNLMGWANGWAFEIKASRKACADEARLP